MYCFRSILQISATLIGFRNTNDFVNLGVCKHEFKLTCRGYCRFTLKGNEMFLKSLTWDFVLNSQGILGWRVFVRGVWHGGFLSGCLCPGGYVLIPGA